VVSGPSIKYQFKGTTKIKESEDVAQIMSLLQKQAVNTFYIHIDQSGTYKKL
jgi:hypothetical protein